MPGPNLQLKPVRSTLWAEVSRLAFVIGLEQRILMLIVSYALAIALFSLVVPLTVQELVNSFAISIQPVMIVTLALIILIGLLFIGFFRVFQTSATEILFQRLYTRIAIAMTEHLPRVREDVFVPSYANYFGEAELLPRAVVVVLVDLINVVISGATGMLSRLSSELPRLQRVSDRRVWAGAIHVRARRRSSDADGLATPLRSHDLDAGYRAKSPAFQGHPERALVAQ